LDEIILIGAGGHARACIDVIELSGRFKLAGLIEKEKVNNQKNLGYPIIGTDNDLKDLRQKYDYALITVGQIKSPKIRIRLYDILNQLNYFLPSIISPKAYVSKHAQIEAGAIIMHGAIVNARAKIGKNCIINNTALIEHDAIIGDHCHIATGAIVNGEVSVGSESFVGSGVVTKQCISIGNNCIIGAGAILNSDVEPNQLIKK
jgi:sugar O-acyltransferase (sialic acid O-acetyltransferase NeuD family)